MGAADRRHMRRRGREFHAIAVVAGTDRDGDAGMVVCGLIALRAAFAAAIAIADGMRAQFGRLIFSRGKI